MENISRNSRENQEYEAHYADDESGIHARYHEQTGSTEDWQPEKTGYILSFFAILIAIILFGFKVYITQALFWTVNLQLLQSHYFLQSGSTKRIKTVPNSSGIHAGRAIKGNCVSRK